MGLKRPIFTNLQDKQVNSCADFTQFCRKFWIYDWLGIKIKTIPNFQFN